MDEKTKTAIFPQKKLYLTSEDVSLLWIFNRTLCNRLLSRGHTLVSAPENQSYQVFTLEKINQLTTPLKTLFSCREAAAEGDLFSQANLGDSYCFNYLGSKNSALGSIGMRELLLVDIAAHKHF